MRVKYNAPVTLTFALLSSAVLFLNPASGNRLIPAFFMTYPEFQLTSPFFYFRLFSHILGHADWVHLAGNFTLILLLGPILEEKYGSRSLLTMILATAFATGILNAAFFSVALMGSSGIAFMMILLVSFTNFRAHEIPLTFILIAMLFLSGEVMNALTPDRISQFGHLLGGLFGSMFGFNAAGPGKK